VKTLQSAARTSLHDAHANGKPVAAKWQRTRKPAAGAAQDIAASPRQEAT
jgi:hypothetical protein